MDRLAYVEVEDGPRLRCCIPDGLAINEGDQCIVEADSVLEYGRLASCEPTAVSADVDLPKVLRRATLQDQAKAHEGHVRSRMAAETCAERAEKHGLAIRFVRVRFSFDRTVLVVLFTAEERLDFRDMVKELAEEFRARIEMRQVGVRDEAGIIGGLGPCGRGLCCCTWLHNFASINVKMAKSQRISLNPATISGMCGRLKCCLRYEYDCYREMGRYLPRDGALVECPAGRGCVIDKNVLKQCVRVRMEDQRVLEFEADDVMPAHRPQRSAPVQPAGEADESKKEESG